MEQLNHTLKLIFLDDFKCAFKLTLLALWWKACVVI